MKSISKEVTKEQFYKVIYDKKLNVHPVIRYTEKQIVSDFKFMSHGMSGDTWGHVTENKSYPLEPKYFINI